MDTMKKIVITDRYKVEIEEVPIPEVKPGEILVKTIMSGISAGTEMMVYRGTHPNLTEKTRPHWSDYPIYPGYELVGEVVAVGEDASIGSGGLDYYGKPVETLVTQASEFKVGDRVICNGEHGEYAISAATLAAKLPNSVCNEDATLTVLGSTSMHSVRRADIQYGDVVAVIGMGVLGNLIMQHAKNYGAKKVFAIDLDDERLKYAKLAGADVCINSGKEDPAKVISEMNDGILADVVIEASGAFGTEQMACKMARARGKVMISGWHTKHLDLHFGEMFNKELTLTTSCATGPQPGMPYSYVRWAYDQNLKWAVELFEQGKLKRTFEPSKFNYREIKKVYDLIDKQDPSIGMQAILLWE
jgi:2-desacetyl-2-hydroxyethyl bacteriochlorophyllide A dehydrogenase